MSELDWEEAPSLEVPQAHVPLVRNWVGPAFDAWTRGVYPPRRGYTVLIGIFIIPWAIWQFLKLGIYAAGIVLMLLANLVWTVAECITYRHRLTRARTVVYTRYLADLHGEDTPEL